MVGFVQLRGGGRVLVVVRPGDGAGPGLPDVGLGRDAAVLNRLEIGGLEDRSGLDAVAVDPLSMFRTLSTVLAGGSEESLSVTGFADEVGLAVDVVCNAEAVGEVSICAITGLPVLLFRSSFIVLVARVGVAGVDVLQEEEEEEDEEHEDGEVGGLGSEVPDDELVVSESEDEEQLIAIWVWLGLVRLGWG